MTKSEAAQMVKKPLRTLLNTQPVICAVKSLHDLEKSLLLDESNLIFILFGDIVSIAEIVGKAAASSKHVFVHIDLIDGLAPRDISVAYIAKHTGASGIISTRGSLLRSAKTLGLWTIQRFFVLDSMALVNIERQIPFNDVDAIEILPGNAPKTIKKVSAFTQKPIIASGMVNDKEDVINALGAGAHAVSSSVFDVWAL